jgi:type VI secretion system protein ImpF
VTEVGTAAGRWSVAVPITMPRPEREPNILASVLDRLLDDHPAVTSEPVVSRAQSLRALKRAVSRDLEALLNSRRELLDDPPEELVEISRSIVTYGLPDFTSFNLAATDDRSRLRRCLEDAVTTFEPRLRRVRVTLESPRPHERALRFRIEALLRTDPAPEPVTFDMVLQLHTQEYIIQRQD